MHSMPKPIVHRDVKSMNIMCISEEIDKHAGKLVGKVGDCVGYEPSEQKPETARRSD